MGDDGSHSSGIRLGRSRHKASLLWHRGNCGGRTMRLGRRDSTAPFGRGMFVGALNLGMGPKPKGLLVRTDCAGLSSASLAAQQHLS